MPHELITFFQNAGTGDLIFIGSIVLLWLLLLLYELLFHLRLAFYKLPSPEDKNIPISIVIVERNEEENLKKNLAGWLSLDYPTYEVLVVDDFSEDNSLTTIGLLKLQYPRLKLTGLSQETRYSQKLSRNLALKAASFSEVVFVSPSMQMPEGHWLTGIAGAFANGKNVVVGYTGLVPSKGFFHILYRIESFFQQTESMAFCLNGLPYVVNEENVAFRKQAYFDINGFAGKISEEYLNLELVLNDIIKRKENAILPAGNLTLRKEVEAGKTEFNELLNKSYLLNNTLSFSKKLVILVINIMKILWIPAVIVCLAVYPVLWMILLITLIILALFYIIRIKRLQNRLKEPKIFLSSFIYGIISPYLKLVSRWVFTQRRKLNNGSAK
jgi:glycosyltransferase involved in cell wall biosynthesis